MSKDSQINGAPVSLVLGGQEFRAFPLSDRDHSELDLWCQSKIIKMARASCEGCTPEEAKITMQAAMDKAASVSWMASSSLFETFDGAARLAWQMVSKESDLSYEQLRPLVTSVEDLRAISDAFALLYKSDLESTKKSTSGKKKSR